MPTATHNPVVRKTPLAHFPGWAVLEYADGEFACEHTAGVAWACGYPTFAAAVAFARGNGETWEGVTA